MIRNIQAINRQTNGYFCDILRFVFDISESRHRTYQRTGAGMESQSRPDPDSPQIVRDNSCRRDGIEWGVRV